MQSALLVQASSKLKEKLAQLGTTGSAIRILTHCYYGKKGCNHVLSARFTPAGILVPPHSYLGQRTQPIKCQKRIKQYSSTK